MVVGVVVKGVRMVALVIELVGGVLSGVSVIGVVVAAVEDRVEAMHTGYPYSLLQTK